MDAYELHQTSCRLPADDFHLIQVFFKNNIVNYLNDMSNDTIQVNVIGSPSDAGVVFKINHHDLGCFALKLMPIFDSDGRNELTFSQLLSKNFPTRFPVVYCQAAHVSLLRTSGSVIGIPAKNWYSGSTANSLKFEKHQKLYDEVVKFNQKMNYPDNAFHCNILVSRLYWGDLLAFFHSNMISASSSSSSSSLSTFNRCEQSDPCRVLSRMKDDVPSWKRILTTILDSIHILRKWNIIHGDLHCGNVLLEFDGTPIIHDFGTTQFYSTPKNRIQLGYSDTVDFRKLMNAILLEVDPGTLLGKYLKDVVEKTDAYVGTLYDIHMPVTDIGILPVAENRDGKLSPDLKGARKAIQVALKVIVVETEVEDDTQELRRLLQLLNLSPNITLKELNSEKRRFLQTDHRETYNRVKELFSSTKELLSKKKKSSRGGGGGRGRRTRRTKKVSHFSR